MTPPPAARAPPLAMRGEEWLATDRRSGLVSQPFLDQAAGNGIATRHEERAVLGQVLRPQLLARQPARAFELRFVDAEIERLGLGMKADHHRGRERPGLRRTVDHVPDAHFDFLVNL